MVLIPQYTVAVEGDYFQVKFDRGVTFSYRTANVNVIATPHTATIIHISSDGFEDLTSVHWRGCKNLYETTRADTITAMNALITAANAPSNEFATLTVTGAATVGSLSTTGAVTAGSATLGTMTVSSSGVLGGTYTLGVTIPVRAQFARANVTNSPAHAGPASTSGYDTALTANWGKTVTFDRLALGADDSTGTYRLSVIKNGSAIAIDGANTFKDFVITTLIDELVQAIDSFTMTDGDTVYLNVHQTAGTTGSEVSIQLWGSYTI